MRTMIYTVIFFNLLSIRNVFGQELPMLSGIRSKYFILNNGEDSCLSNGLKNSSVQMIYLLFAAEEDPIGLDPGLSIDGRWRSIHLMNILKDEDIAACFSTPFRRNELTLQVLSEKIQIPITYYDQADLKSLFNKIQNLKNNSTVVMVHKETLPLIIEHFTQKAFTESIVNQPSDRIFVLERPVKGTSKIQTFRYNIR
ncbi:MAG: hypothetical protein ABIO44_00605 [Saprospiraceae bacterium]